jgi:hypothetical protein
MDLLTLATGCSLFISIPCSSPPLPSPTLNGISRWQPIIADAASTFALPEAWVAAVMAKESGGRTVMNGKPIASSAGAMGLMQVMPGTYQDLRRQFGLGADPHAPRDNILAGTAYLQQMYRRYGYPAMFAAYNAGPGRYEDFLYRRRPLPGETLAYVAGIAPGAEIAFGFGKSTEGSVVARKAGAPKPAKSNAIFFAPSAEKALFVTRAAPSRAQD